MSVKLNPIEPPSREYRKVLHGIYENLYHSKLVAEKKIKLLTYILAWEPWTWRVVGISKSALELIKNQNFKKAKGVVRGHKIDRRETYGKLIKTHHKLDVWWETVWENDQTRLITKDENKVVSLLNEDDVCVVDLKRGMFECNKLIGYKFRVSAEGKYCEELWKRHFE
jgi:hypothetical protein